MRGFTPRRGEGAATVVLHGPGGPKLIVKEQLRVDVFAHVLAVLRGWNG